MTNEHFEGGRRGAGLPWLKLMVIWGLTMLLVGCGRHGVTGSEPAAEEMLRPEGNGVYYWKTVFRLDDWEREFMTRHQIRTLYVRLFDVDRDKERGMPVPIASTQFADTVPEGVSVVPVVYITKAGLRDINDYDTLFYRRIVAMARRNGFEDKVREIELDCDWTKSNQEEFFTFCERIGRLAKADGIGLSATIRLHQLRGEAPPVDRGVLMLYNTGSLYDPDTENSILRGDDVRPYLARPMEYALPLSVAYPTYAWAILIKEGKFGAILHKTDFTDGELYRACGDNVYEVVADHYVENHHLRRGDRIRVEQSSIEEIEKVKGYVGASLGGDLDCIIYHLDAQNLSQYSETDIQTILKK